MGRLSEQVKSQGGGRLASVSPTPVVQPEGKSVRGFIQNVGKSGGQFLNDTINTIVHPIQTGKAVGSLALGATEKLIPGQQSHEATADAVGGHFKNRYGSWDAAKKTMYEDPIGFLADVSAATGLAGGAAKLTGTVAKAAGAANTASKASEVARVAGGVSAATDPLRLPANAVRASSLFPKVSGFLENSAVRDMTSALKPTKSVTNAHPKVDIPRAALEERIPLSPRGAETISGRIDDVNQAIGDTISASTRKGVTIDPHAVASRADELKSRFMDQVSPQEDLAAIQAKKEAFLNHPKYSAPFGSDPSVRKPLPIPADKAQELKRGTYRELRGKYGTERTAGIETEKALARGLKEELVKEMPELATLNAQDSRLIALEDAFDEALRRIGNRDRVGLKTMIAASADPRALLLAVYDHPRVKSTIAQIKYDLAKGSIPRLPQLPGSQNPIINRLYDLFSPTRLTTPKTVINRSNLQD